MLVISTATKKAYIALSYGGEEYFREIDANCKQSENILFEIDDLLNQVGISFQDIDDVGVVVGPGSFTGIRIGVALVKGLCANKKDLKIIPISTFDFMAERYVEMGKEKDFVCGINALSKRVFVASFNRYGDRISEGEMISFDDFSRIGQEKVVLGEEFDDFCKIELNSISLLRIAEKLQKRGNFVSANNLSPVYIRKSQAEENLN